MKSTCTLLSVPVMGISRCPDCSAPVRGNARTCQAERCTGAPGNLARARSEALAQTRRRLQETGKHYKDKDTTKIIKQLSRQVSVNVFNGKTQRGALRFLQHKETCYKREQSATR